MISPAIDAEYEACCGVARWEKQYWWPERVWRWVKTTRLEWGRVISAPDPDAAMQPEALDSPQSRAALSRRAATEQAVRAALRDAGRPMIALALAEATGYKPETVLDVLRRRPDWFASDGRRYKAQWTLVED